MRHGSGSPRLRERLTELAFLLAQLESGMATSPRPAAALLDAMAGEAGMPREAAGLLREAAALLGPAEGDAVAVAAAAASGLVERAIEAIEAAGPAGAEGGAATCGDYTADPEMVASFELESLQLLNAAERAALDLDADPTSMDAVAALFRCFHTIKGTAGFLDVPEIVELSHGAESLLSRLREGREPVAAELELVFRSIDTLRRLVERLRSSGAGPVEWRELGAALEVAAARAEQRVRQPAGKPPGEQPRQPGAAGPAAAVAGEPRPGVDVGPAWTRVRTDRLDRLIDGLGELLIAQSVLHQDPAIRAAVAHSDVARKAWEAGKIVRDLQQLAVSMRTVPVAGLFQKSARLVRELARARGAAIHLEVEGEETEIDRNMVDLLGDPLVHMIRNAVDHGIEEAAERRAAGKPADATIRLRAASAGSEVVLELSDDGRGLDYARIRERARERGLLDSDTDISDYDLLRLIFLPGFSTARSVTDLSGRGVGMDVVRRNIEGLRGRIDATSTAGEGTTFTIRIPLTLAITDGLLVRVGDEQYVLPSRHVQTSFRPEPGMVAVHDGGGERILVLGQPAPLVRLGRLLGIADARTDPAAAVIVVVGTTSGRHALLVDELLAQLQVVAKPLGPPLHQLPWLAGGAVLGDGRVGLILDIPAIAAWFSGPAEAAAAAGDPLTVGVPA